MTERGLEGCDFADIGNEMGDEAVAELLDAARPLSPRTINVRQGELHTLASEAERALIEAEAPIYIRGMLVRPAVDDMAAAQGRRTKVARMIPVTAPMMVDHLSRSANWQKFDGRKKEYVPCDPPTTVASTILSRDGEWNLRSIVGAITAPTMRPDGTILSEPGYDSTTRLVLLDPPAMPAIPAKPAKAQAAEALAELNRLLCAFPFVDDASRSVALSALITPVVRGAMPVAPLHATSAPVAGSGKSYLIDLAAAIAIGDRAPVISAGKTEEETEKRLGAALLDGMPVVSIDNVNGGLGGDALCQYVERPVVAIRPLGVSKLMKIESRATLFATGNNIQIHGDMTRRTLLCQLDPAMERPELRTFETRPFDMILADRGRYIAAALTVVRAYQVAGCPGALPPLASFEQWSLFVRSALVWLGKADPVETMEAARADDPVLGNLATVLSTLQNVVGSVAAYTTAEIIARANSKNSANGEREYPELFDALVEVADNRRGEICSRRLGTYLGGHKRRIVDGKRLIAGTDAHSKVATWRVESVT